MNLNVFTRLINCIRDEEYSRIDRILTINFPIYIIVIIITIDIIITVCVINIVDITITFIWNLGSNNE